jgi:hypothetical protein
MEEEEGDSQPHFSVPKFSCPSCPGLNFDEKFHLEQHIFTKHQPTEKRKRIIPQKLSDQDVFLSWRY